ncbi:hypothetical protein QF046_000001, partial [Microbacterium sp. W4I4]|uniref:hypothetical protein n=1 Tax=Microbacterium sp. W4I4 TaxID=3042295 RepID=UPI00277F55DF
MTKMNKSLLTYPYANPQEEDWTLIQRNSQPSKKLDEDNLAFDKCTLLSSQGSDAPTHPPQRGEKRKATSQSCCPT